MHPHALNNLLKSVSNPSSMNGHRLPYKKSPTGQKLSTDHLFSLELVLNLHTPLDLWYLRNVSVNELPAALNTTLQSIDIAQILGRLVRAGECQSLVWHVLGPFRVFFPSSKPTFNAICIVWEVLTRLDHEGTYAATYPLLAS